MRHGMVNRKLGRTSSHRAAMFRNQLASLIQNERIITTLPKAKELRPQIERLVTLARTDSVHNRRQAASVIGIDALVSKLFDTLGPRFAQRPGGYTRIIKLGARRGDAAEMAILEFMGYEPKLDEKPSETAAGKKAAAPKKEAKAPAADSEEDEAEDKPKKKPAAKKPAKKADAEAKPKKKAPAKKKSGK